MRLPQLRRDRCSLKNRIFAFGAAAKICAATSIPERDGNPTSRSVRSQRQAFDGFNRAESIGELAGDLIPTGLCKSGRHIPAPHPGIIDDENAKAHRRGSKTSIVCPCLRGSE